MSFIVIIPARFSSIRLPGKPLIDIGGKPMIERVYGLAKQSKAKEVYVATDHKEILDCCSSFGAKAVMTKPEHLNPLAKIGVAVPLKVNLGIVFWCTHFCYPFLMFKPVSFPSEV